MIAFSSIWPLESYSQDFTQLGGALTTTTPGRNALQVFAPNVTSEERKAVQLSGFAPFHTRITKKQGLGPRFINSSCAGCHVQNGKGRTKLSSNPERLNGMVIKVSLPGLEADGRPIDIPRIGEQLQDRNVRGDAFFATKLKWETVPGSYPDGSTYSLRRPLLSFRMRGRAQDEVLTSLRMTPALVGMGLLEAIPEDVILGFSDPDDADGDGISGVPQYVPNNRTGTLQIGRFGFRASHPTLEQQTAAAAFFDMGIVNPLFNPSGSAVELTEEVLNQITVYQALGGVPIARDQSLPHVVAGKELFQTVGCDGCHKFNITTSDPVNPELDGQVIHPFTDLLLHDMGPDLADERAEYVATGSEWRTTPLWGIGFLPTVSKVRQTYLHDGRARTLEEAILWHGGEAETSKEAFKNLSLAQRKALIAFLESL